MSKKYEIHPIAKCYPKITGKDYTELRKSIRTQGLLNPITLFEGQILDGSNRYRACLEENVTPAFRDLPEGLNAIEYVVSQNESRRHLTVEQRAFIGAKLAKLGVGGDRRSSGFKTSLDGMSTVKVAKRLKISPKSIERARRVQKVGAPAVVAAAEAGEVNLSQAESISALPAAQQTPILEVIKAQKEILNKARDFRQGDEFKERVSKHQAIVDAPSVYPIDLPVPEQYAQIAKDLRANEKQIGDMEADELARNTTRFADRLSIAEGDARLRFWANTVKRKIAARQAILDAAKAFKKEIDAEKAEKKPVKTPEGRRKVPVIDRQWEVFVPQFRLLLKLFTNKEDRPDIRRRIDNLLTQAGWPSEDGGVVIT
jgi:hypothetical protein